MILGWIVVPDGPWVALGIPKERTTTHDYNGVTEKLVWTWMATQLVRAYLMAVQTNDRVEFHRLNAPATVTTGDTLSVTITRPFNP